MSLWKQGAVQIQDHHFLMLLYISNIFFPLKIQAHNLTCVKVKKSGDTNKVTKICKGKYMTLNVEVGI